MRQLRLFCRNASRPPKPGFGRPTGAVFLFALAGLCAARLSAPPSVLAEEVFFVIDLHVDLSYRSLYKASPFGEGSGQFRARDLKAGGVSGVVLPLYVPKDAPGGRSLEEFERSYAHVYDALLRTPPYSLPGCDIGRAGAEARSVGTFLAFEGAAPLGNSEREVRKWVLRGVRSFGLVHTEDNAYAASSGAGPSFRPKQETASGLSDLGKTFVTHVARAGGLVDVSHASDETVDEVLALSHKLGRPVLATHSNARALSLHPRNLTDAQIRAIARTGGVIGVNFHALFLRKRAGASASLVDVVEQVRHLLRVAGDRAVALGSDFEGGISAVPELSNAGRFQHLARALLGAGVSREQIRAVFSENARRVLCERRAMEF